MLRNIESQVWREERTDNVRIKIRAWDDSVNSKKGFTIAITEELLEQLMQHVAEGEEYNTMRLRVERDGSLRLGY